MPARSTDPLTSKSARKSDTLEARILGVLLSHGPKTNWELVLQLNADRLSASHDPDNPPREITIDSVSTCMRPMQRRGEVHEKGTTENMVRNTGNQVIVWAYGPDPNPGVHNPMSKVETGPRRLYPEIQFKPFTDADIEEMNKTAGGYLDIFTTLLNAKIMERVR